jgi:hypothetical protein
MEIDVDALRAQKAGLGDDVVIPLGRDIPVNFSTQGYSRSEGGK